ncbi:divergent polysaccharide deacetylase family protein [Desulfocurvus sp. DL9XJH121]
MHEEEGNSGATAARRRNLIWILAALGLVACVLLLGRLLRSPEAPTASRAPEVRMAAQQPPAPTEAPAPGEAEPPAADAANATAPDGYQGFEETLGVPLERVVRQVDYALVESLLLTGYDPHALAIARMEVRSYHDEEYHFQALDISLDGKRQRFLETLETALRKWAPEAELAPDGSGNYTISVTGTPTHSLRFLTPAPEPPPQAAGLLAVVIDDLGRSVPFARDLAALPYPVTFSVLPHQAHSREVASVAAEAGREVLLHLPMEPKAWPKVNPGKGALFTTMSPDDIRRALAADLAEVPGADGANNHMGSRFTQTGPAMAVVMAELGKRKMFFLDSLTAPHSKGVGEARAAGIKVYRRSVFLDNIRDTKAILRQLEKADRQAAASGQAVAIGHPYPETLAALKAWGENRERAARIVSVGTLKPVTK